MISCGCISQYPIEFPIHDDSTNTKNSQIILKDVLEENQGTICDLKRKIICDFYKIFNKLKCGIQPDLGLLLEEISVVYGSE